MGPIGAQELLSRYAGVGECLTLVLFLKAGTMGQRLFVGRKIFVWEIATVCARVSDREEPRMFHGLIRSPVLLFVSSVTRIEREF